MLLFGLVSCLLDHLNPSSYHYWHSHLSPTSANDERTSERNGEKGRSEPKVVIRSPGHETRSTLPATSFMLRYYSPPQHGILLFSLLRRPIPESHDLLAAAADSEFPNAWQTRQVAVVVAFSSRTCIRVGETHSTCSCSPSPSCGPTTTRGAAAMIIPVCSIILIGPGKRRT